MWRKCNAVAFAHKGLGFKYRQHLIFSMNKREFFPVKFELSDFRLSAQLLLA